MIQVLILKGIYSLDILFFYCLKFCLIIVLEAGARRSSALTRLSILCQDLWCVVRFPPSPVGLLSCVVPQCSICNYLTWIYKWPLRQAHKSDICINKHLNISCSWIIVTATCTIDAVVQWLTCLTPKLPTRFESRACLG